MTVDVYDGRCALNIIASQVRKSRAHTPSRTSHMPLAHRIHLLFIARKPRFALGGVFRLSLDRARSRGSMVMIFILFRGSFEAVFLPFCSSERPRDYPRPAIRSLPSVSGFQVSGTRRRHCDRSWCQLEGHNHRSGVRHPPVRVPGET